MVMVSPLVDGGQEGGDGRMPGGAPAVGDPGAAADGQSQQAYALRRQADGQLGDQGGALAGGDQREDGGEAVGVVPGPGCEPGRAADLQGRWGSPSPTRRSSRRRCTRPGASPPRRLWLPLMLPLTVVAAVVMARIWGVATIRLLRATWQLARGWRGLNIEVDSPGVAFQIRFI
jgi:hypothetical protein